MESWWIDSDNAIQLTGLKDVVTDNYVNDATVTAALTDSDGNAVSGADAISLVYRSGSDGHYVGEIPHDVELVEAQQYTLTVTAVGAGFQLVVKITRRAAYKGP